MYPTHACVEYKCDEIFHLYVYILTEKVSQEERPIAKEGPACIEECMDDLCGTKGSNGDIMLVPIPFDSSPRLSQNPIQNIPEEDALTESCNGGGRRDFIEKQLMSISENLQNLVDHHRDMDNENDVLDEWKMLATAIDRLCLYIFLVGSIILFVILGAELLRRSGEASEDTFNAFVGLEGGMYNTSCDSLE